jgi:cell wall-associated NlpC family hydrolase
MRVPLTVRRSICASLALGSAFALALPGSPAASAALAPRATRGSVPPVELSLAPLAVPAEEARIVQAAPAPVAAPVVLAPGLPAVAAATSVLGTPYRWGGAAPGGFDCSGLVRWAWSRAGVTLPHNASAQRGVTRPVSAGELQPGDLVFYGRPVSHVAIYAGNGMIVHSPHSGDVVKVVPLGASVGKPIVGFGRVK